MFYQKFKELLFSNLFTLILIGVLAFIIYIPILKKLKFNFFSPICVPIFTSLMDVVVFSFLITQASINKEYIGSFFSTEVFFLLGLCIHKTKNNKNAIIRFKPYEFFLYKVLVFIYFTANLIIYLVKGIPLFMESRFEASLNGGGFGIFTRLKEFFGIPVLYYSFYIIFLNGIKQKYKQIAKIVMFFYIITLILSGSKVAFYSLFEYYFILSITFRKQQPYLYNSFTRKGPIYIILFLFTMLIFVFIKNGSQFLVSFIFRIVCQADSIFLTYVGDNLDKLTKYNPFEFLFTNKITFFL